MHREIAEYNSKRDGRQQMQIRISINYGYAVMRDGDIFGDSVNLAARLQALAKPGGICVSQPVYDHLRKRKNCDFEDLGLQSVKNIASPIHAYRVS